MTEELEKHFLKCEFSDECDICDDPKGQTWATYCGYPVCECTYYCERCAKDVLEESS